MAVLEVRDLEVAYDGLRALKGVSLNVDEGEVVALIGANGAGKSSLLNAVAGSVTPVGGVIEHRGEPVDRVPTHARAGRGLVLVPEGRRLFGSLSVEDNIAVAAARARPGPWGLKRCLELFPLLAPLLTRPAAVLSGGEQHAVALCRGLVMNPDVLMLDEASLGLAPAVVEDVYAVFPEISGAGTALLVVEQDTSLAVRVADRFYCLLEGEISLQGAGGAADRAEIERAYFGSSRWTG